MAIKGNACVIVIDVQGEFGADGDESSNVTVDQQGENIVAKDRILLDKCREIGVPIVFLQECHRDSLVDMGRETEGDEPVHCLESSPSTRVAEKALGRIPEKEPLVPKRRYSGFLYTDLEIVLSGLGIHPADTLILIGGLTDICVRYTFVDAHQRDYHLRVVTDCCTPSSQYAHEAAIANMHYLQHEADVTLEEILVQLDEYATERA